MKCPGQDNEQIILVTRVNIQRVLPLAKGGGVSTAGQTVTQADIRAAHEENSEFWTNPKGGVERYYEVFPMAVEAVGADGAVIPAPELSDELADQKFWYFPSDEGRPGRGLTLPDGVSIAAAAKAAAKAIDPNEGNVTAAPVAAAPKAVAAPKAALKPAVAAAPAKALAVAPKAPVAVAKPAAAPVAAPVAKAAPVLARKPGIVLPKKA